MNCNQARPLLDLYVDDELDATNQAAFEEHLRDCNACSQAWQNRQSLKKALKQGPLYFAAPEELRRRLKTQLRIQSSLQNRSPWNLLTIATTSLAVISLAALLVVWFTRASAPPELAREVLASHIRSLMAGHCFDIASTNESTVKIWLADKLDFSPPVKNLAATHFALAGGRLDYLDGQAAAAVVFERDKHIINLFIWPTKNANSEPEPLKAIQNYHLIQWNQNGMTYWAVSDLDENELAEFAALFGS